MRSELSAPEQDDRRIIPFPRLLAEETFAASGWDHVPERMSRATEERGIGSMGGEAAGRHYLKIMLPFIPIMMFVVGFVYCSLLVDPRTPVPATSPAARATTQSALPLIGALLLALTSGLLCVMIYCGYLRASGDGITNEK
jgi:hypothetical protein